MLCVKQQKKPVPKITGNVILHENVYRCNLSAMAYLTAQIIQMKAHSIARQVMSEAVTKIEYGFVLNNAQY